MLELEYVILGVLIGHFVFVVTTDHFINKKIRKCSKQLKTLKKYMFNDENALGAISDKEHIALIQMESQLPEVRFCLRCPYYLRYKENSKE